MTERLTLAEYQEKYGKLKLTKSKPRQHRKAKQKLALAVAVLIGELERKLDIDGIEPEYPFAKERGRKYRLDLAIPHLKVGLEVHGGAFIKRSGGGTGGAHHTIEGRARDMAKGNLAAVMGWIVIEVSPNEVADGTAYRWIEEAIAYRLGDT